MSRVVAVACARMDSKRFPGKCLAQLANKPLLQYTIDLARAANLPLYVWTRDAAIMEYASDKCPMIYEPARLYDTREDTTREKMRYANDVLRAEYIVLLQPTQPVRSSTRVLTWVAMVRGEGADYAYTVNPDGRTSGTFYAYSSRYLSNDVGDIDARVLVLPDRQEFDIDMPEDLERCERWLRG
jgi:CMP-N-acetylneuraminic acid synthetase